jgi:hypothetical protein
LAVKLDIVLCITAEACCNPEDNREEACAASGIKHAAGAVPDHAQ